MVSMFTELQGELKINEPLSQHTSWRVGGIA
ncbi:MAG TPA: UDP-N-acetylenolpyruvoylglucosamine reductase, partial [Methylophaga sp.]|nr:UDP-N-acetylenolpyruvoylglucosamine reductase [Methylophaga sp.]